MPTPLGERVRELRLKRGLTLEALAERVGSSKSYMWEIENKPMARPSAEKLARIAEVLGVTTDYLVNEARVEPTADDRDQAFFHRFQSADERVKNKLRAILDIIEDEDK